jgi:spore germination cell wall hydrolase CwlJ-like protein
MNTALKILHNVEQFFDRNHTILLRFGGLFCLLFLGLFAPYHAIHTLKQESSSVVAAYQTHNAYLVSEIHALSNENRHLHASFEQKQKVMREVECLAKNIYFEAGGEPRAGKIAVAEVTMNRVKSGQFPKTVCAVVHQKSKNKSGINICQFSWVCEGKNNVRNSSTWRESQRIAESILISKKRYGIIGTDAKYFHASYMTPNWADESRVIAQIGNHIFYR